VQTEKAFIMWLCFPNQLAVVHLAVVPFEHAIRVMLHLF
jgi:hypothetical protein